MSISGITNLHVISQAVHPDKVAKASGSEERQSVSAGGKDLPQQADSAVTQKEVSDAIRDIQKYAPSLSRELQFQMDEGTSSTVITVRDAETQEIVRQIPSEEVIAIARYIAESAPDGLSGILLDGRG